MITINLQQNHKKKTIIPGARGFNQCEDLANITVKCLPRPLDAVNILFLG